MVLRGVVSRDTLAAVDAELPGLSWPDEVDPHHPDRTHPDPGRYTEAVRALTRPGLAAVLEEPVLSAAASQVLDDDPRLLMFAVYDRTPGGRGAPPHHDDKRWRPVGSSLRWCFAIAPLTDFDAAAGPLEIARGSHHVERHTDAHGITRVRRPEPPADDTWLDLEIRRGDLALMDMHVWHRAGDNRSGRSRLGVFTKFAAACAPPSTGWFTQPAEVLDVLGPRGRTLVPSVAAEPVATTRAVLQRGSGDGAAFLLVERPDGRRELPGGPATDEAALADWDRGNHVAALFGHLERTVGARPPWCTWVADVHEQGHRCRVYGYRMPDRPVGLSRPGLVWVSRADLVGAPERLAHGHEIEAVDQWRREDLLRGVAVPAAQASFDQYAY